MPDTQKRTYIAIDLKSFYASVECVERSLDPLTTNLVVADADRTEKTICLAVSPSLKAFGIPGRARLFEVNQKVKEVNAFRAAKLKNRKFEKSSYFSEEIKDNPDFSVGFITATPRMSLYMEYSTRIYQIYLKYIAPEDIHVYSIDEVFMDVTNYLAIYHLSAHDLAMKMIQDVLKTTKITATAGIGTNLYLCKAAMDIVAKHVPADKDGVRIVELDEMSYRKLLWNHQPLTDFWRVGKGYGKRLNECGLYTMGDIARCSLGKENEYYNEELLFHLFGVNAELLIDHAWGYEPCTIAEIKAYRPLENSIGSGQVLQSPYPSSMARIVVKEMADSLALTLFEKKLVTDQLVLTVGYDVENLKNPEIKKCYHGQIVMDSYGRQIPKAAHGTTHTKKMTSSSTMITEAVMELYDRIINKSLLIRRLNLTAARIKTEESAKKETEYEQLDLFSYMQPKQETKQSEKEKKLQQALLEIKSKFGKNAVLKATSLEEGSTAIDRNRQIGGHKS